MFLRTHTHIYVSTELPSGTDCKRKQQSIEKVNYVLYLIGKRNEKFGTCSCIVAFALKILVKAILLIWSKYSEYLFLKSWLSSTLSRKATELQTILS
jgi:hypothetical protein